MSADAIGAVPQCRHTDTHLFQTIQWWWPAFEENNERNTTYTGILINWHLLPVWVTERPQLRIWSTSFCYEDKKFPNLQLLLTEIQTSVSSSEVIGKYALKASKAYLYLKKIPLTCIVKATKKPEIYIKNIVAFNRDAGFLEPLSMSVRQHVLSPGDISTQGCAAAVTVLKEERSAVT